MTLATWRDIAIVLLALEAFIISLVPGAILFFLVKGMLWLIRKLRHYAPVVQGYFRKAVVISEDISHKVAAPVLAAEAKAAQVSAMQTAAKEMIRNQRRGTMT